MMMQMMKMMMNLMKMMVNLMMKMMIQYLDQVVAGEVAAILEPLPSFRNTIKYKV